MKFKKTYETAVLEPATETRQKLCWRCAQSDDCPFLTASHKQVRRDRRQCETGAIVGKCENIGIGK